LTGVFIMENQEEIWRDVKGFEGSYQVSSLGRIKSLKRKVKKLDGERTVNEKIFTERLNTGKYYTVGLYKNKKYYTFQVHQLVAIAFLNHTPNGYDMVVNHKNFIRTDNRIDNLEIITNRENTNNKHIPHSSQYTGVWWCKCAKKWTAKIWINKKQKHLGYFKNEDDAHLAYENELNKMQ